jgi:septal ring factor EnvC (AmiA/AmiB activator)
MLESMDHLEVLREKIARLRSEIAQLQEMTEQYRREDRHDTEAHVRHGQRKKSGKNSRKLLASADGFAPRNK